MVKVGIYLGSFNPFHNGHLDVVKKALDDFNMDIVVIVPTMKNPWKKEEPLSMEKRIGLIKASLKSLPQVYDSRHAFVYVSNNKCRMITIDKIEESLTPPYYSYATLHALKTKYCNHEIFVICGEDVINDIPDWMNGEAILKDYNFLICDRSGISSSDIRNKVKNKESIEGLVSSNILKRIECLYGD